MKITLDEAVLILRALQQLSPHAVTDDVQAIIAKLKKATTYIGPS